MIGNNEMSRPWHEITKAPFGELHLYRDKVPHSAALNMAIDEALLETVTVPTIRFYRWDHPALSFGYFGKFADAAEHSNRDFVRRWTGGGIVFHGNDLTYSLVIPARDPAFTESSRTIYENVHRGICDALGGSGQRVDLEGRDAALQRQSGRRLAVESSDRPRTSRRDVPTDDCFANPVPADVMLNGRKIAGAAQRRTRIGLLQQGSIQQFDLPKNFEDAFAAQLSNSCQQKELEPGVFDRAERIAVQKYATTEWLRRR
jgi:lipoyl(octanoyl) transferase